VPCLLLSLCLNPSPAATEERSAVPTPQSPAAAEPFEPTWESLERYKVPDWFRDAKFGLFVHWGPQTLGGASASKDGTKSPWKELAAGFKGERFDAKAWAELFRKSGAKYVVQVAEHHDAYAMYDSSRTPWSSAKMAPKRDFVAELSTAVRKEGLIFGASSHTEENWWFYSEPPKRLPPLPQPGVPSTGEQPPREWLEDWEARLEEIVAKYDPQIFWFDWSIEQPAFEPYLRKFAAHYYNRAARNGRGVVLNYKYSAFPSRAAVLDVSVGTARLSWKPEGARDLPWQFDTWSADGHWFWRPTMRMRPAAALIAEMADVVSKNGNYLLNVTPDPDGVITPEQAAPLLEIGGWLSANGEAVFGTRPWKVYGEGPTPGLGPSFRPDVPKTPYTPQDIRFTAKGTTVYAVVLAPPEGGAVLIRTMAAGSPHVEGEIGRVTLLGHDGPVKWSRGPEGLSVDLAGLKTGRLPVTLKIERK
jgi:alpha-L-fucosidase